MMAKFLAMGGYAAFVWPAYAVTLLGLAGAVALTLSAYTRAKARLENLAHGNARP